MSLSIQKIEDLKRLAAEIRDDHEAVLGYIGKAEDACNQALVSAIACGHKLSQAKSKVRFGDWLDWLAANVRFSRHTAANYMRISAKSSAGKIRAGSSLREALGLSDSSNGDRDLQALPENQRLTTSEDEVSKIETSATDDTGADSNALPGPASDSPSEPVDIATEPEKSPINDSRAKSSPATIHDALDGDLIEAGLVVPTTAERINTLIEELLKYKDAPEFADAVRRLNSVACFRCNDGSTPALLSELCGRHASK